MCFFGSPCRKVTSSRVATPPSDLCCHHLSTMTAGEDPTGRTSASPPPQPAATDDIHPSTTSSSSSTTPITAAFHHHRVRTPFPDCQSVRGHEGGFVQPSSYLRPRGLSHPMAPVQPERAIDREERQGLVSVPLLSSCLLVFFAFSPFSKTVVVRAFLFTLLFLSPCVFFFPSILASYPLYAPHLT